jgi:hypothetical protein
MVNGQRTAPAFYCWRECMTTIAAAELASWTPVALNLTLPSPSIDWGDFGGRRFAEPFFEDTVALWASNHPPPRVVSTDLDALVVLDQAPSLDPSGFIFHMSRCGSTLVTRLLQQLPGCVVVAEPKIVNDLLLADPGLFDEETRVRLLRLLVRALGRRRFGDDSHFVMKLSSWNVCKLDLFRRAFPPTPSVWLQRRPAEVMASLVAHDPGWRDLRSDRALAEALFNTAADEIAALEPPQVYAAVLRALLCAAQGAPAGLMRTIDYSELPAAVWATMAPLFGLAPTGEQIASMQAQSRYHSKAATPRRFEPQQDADRVSRSIRLLAAAQLDALYWGLSGRTASTPNLRQSGVSPD